MTKLLALLPLAALLAVPAAAVSVTGVTASGGNAVTVVTEADGLLETDIALYSFTPISIAVSRSNEQELDFDWNSLVDIYTAVEGGKNVRSLSIGLQGALFEVVGEIAPTFAGYSWALNDTFDVLTIGFDGAGEPNAVALGNIFGGDNFVIAFVGAEEAGGRNASGGDAVADNLPAAERLAFGDAIITLSAVAVPEPATWAMMIGGFGLVGFVVRRRRATVYA